MVRIEVDAETAKRIEDASEPIELYASDGRQIGYFSHPIPSDEITEARRLASLPSSGRSLVAADTADNARACQILSGSGMWVSACL